MPAGKIVFAATCQRSQDILDELSVVPCIRTSRFNPFAKCVPLGTDPRPIKSFLPSAPFSIYPQRYCIVSPSQHLKEGLENFLYLAMNQTDPKEIKLSESMLSDLLKALGTVLVADWSYGFHWRVERDEPNAVSIGFSRTINPFDSVFHYCYGQKSKSVSYTKEEQQATQECTNLAHSLFELTRERG